MPSGISARRCVRIFVLSWEAILLFEMNGDKVTSNVHDTIKYYVSEIVNGQGGYDQDFFLNGVSTTEETSPSETRLSM